MKIFKLITFSVLFIILFLPTSCSTYFTISDLLGKKSFENPDFINSSYYKTGDEVGYYTDWCKKNNYGGRKTGTEKEKISDCVDAELRVAGLAHNFGSLNLVLTTVFLSIFLIYLYFYIKWLRKNYFK